MVRLGLIKAEVMAKPAIATKTNSVLKLFNALGRDDDEEVLHLFNRASFDPSTPSLKVKSFVDSGE